MFQSSWFRSIWPDYWMTTNNSVIWCFRLASPHWAMGWRSNGNGNSSCVFCQQPYFLMWSKYCYLNIYISTEQALMHMPLHLHVMMIWSTRVSLALANERDSKDEIPQTHMHYADICSRQWTDAPHAVLFTKKCHWIQCSGSNSFQTAELLMAVNHLDRQWQFCIGLVICKYKIPEVPNPVNCWAQNIMCFFMCFILSLCALPKSLHLF